MNHEEMINKAVEAAKNAAPLTVGDGMQITELVQEIAAIVALHLDGDKVDPQEAGAIATAANVLNQRLRQR